MGKAKDLIVKVIPSKIANKFIKKHHYSGKVVPNSQLHFGVFYNNGLHGVASFGPSLDKRKIQGLIKNTGFNDFLELNRLAFDDILPKNSESRAISIMIKLIKKQVAHIKWIISFADACQCGDGTIYRASGFILTGIKKNNHLFRFDSFVISETSLMVHGGSKAFWEYIKKKNGLVHDMSIKTGSMKNIVRKITNGKSSVRNFLIQNGGKIQVGYQLRYIYFIDKSKIKDLSVPIIPFSKIKEMGISMYKGKLCGDSDKNNTPDNQSGKGGVVPTSPLHLLKNNKDQ
jgi:hypothetical protein